MPRMTKAEVDAHQARMALMAPSETKVVHGIGGGSSVPCNWPVSRESDLQDAVYDECLRRGWLPVSSRMDRATTFRMPKGLTVLDFCIARPDGKTLWVECKRKGEKPTLEQNATIAMLRKLGHEAVVVWSFQEFLAVVDKQTEPK